MTSLADGGDVQCAEYTDGFGNRCRRLVVPPGGVAFTDDMIVRDSGMADYVDRNAQEVFAGDLPSEIRRRTRHPRGMIAPVT